MSVAKLRSSFEKKGCQIALWILMVGAAFAIAGTGMMTCFAAQQSQIRNPALDIEVLSVNGHMVSLAAVNAEVGSQRQLLSQQFLFGGVSEQFLEFQATVTALGVLIETHIVGDIARSRGVTVDDGTALAMKGQQIDQQILQFRFEAITSSNLLPDATEQEFQAYFLEQSGQSSSEFKQQVLDDFRLRLDNPDTREALLARYSLDALSLNFLATTAVTEDEVRRSFETLSMKLISFDDLEVSITDRQAEAEKALAELAGGAEFDAVMRKYMDNPVTEPVEFSRPNLDSNEDLKVLNDLEPGQDSAVVLAFGAIPSIYRLVEVNSDLPEDFEDNKVVYTVQLRRNVADLELSRAIDAGEAAATIEWSSAAYEAIYKLSTMSQDQDVSEDELETYLRGLVESGPGSVDDPAGPTTVVLVRYIAMEQLQIRMDVDERKETLTLQAEIISEVLNFTESVSLRLTLVELYGEQEEWEAQADALLMAVKMNRGIDPINQIYFNQINEILAAMETAEHIDESTAKKIHDALLTWSEDVSDANEAAAAAAIDLDKFNIDPLTGEPVGSGDGGSDPDESTESDGGDG